MKYSNLMKQSLGKAAADSTFSCRRQENVESATRGGQVSDKRNTIRYAGEMNLKEET